MAHDPSDSNSTTANIFHIAALEQSADFASRTPIRALFRGVIIPKRNLWPPDRVWDCYKDLARRDLLRYLTQDMYWGLLRYFAKRGGRNTGFSLYRMLTIVDDMRKLGMVVGKRERLELMYALGLSGQFDKMEEVFNTLERDGLVGVSGDDQQGFRTLMVAYGEQTRSVSKVLEVYDRMIRKGLIPDERTYNAFVNILKDRGEPEEVWVWLTDLIAKEKPGQAIDPQLLSNMLMFFASTGRANYTLEVWNMMELRGIPRMEYQYTEIIHKLGRAGYISRAMELFQEMISRGISPTRVTLSAVIDVHAHARPRPNLEAAQRYYELMLELGITPDVRTYGPLIDMYAKRGDLATTQRIYLEMVARRISPTVQIFSSLIECLVGHDDLASATAIFRVMPSAGVEPNEVTYNLLIRSYARAQNLDVAWQLFESMVSADVKPSVVTFSTLIALHADRRDVQGARAVARRMLATGVRPNQYIYASLMDAHGRAGDIAGAERIMQEMVVRGLRPNIISYNTLLSAYVRVGDSDRVLQLYRRMQGARNISLDAYTFSHLIESFARRGAMRAVEELWAGMPAVGVLPNTQCFTILMQGYVWQGNVEGAQDVLKRMIEARVKPNWWTYAILVDAYARKGDVEVARKLVRRFGEESEDTRITDDVGWKVEMRKKRARMMAWAWGVEKGEGSMPEHIGETVEEVLTRAYLHTPWTQVPPAHVYMPLFNKYVQMGETTQAKELFKEMCRIGVSLTSAAFVSLMTLYKRERNAEAVGAIWVALGGPSYEITDDGVTLSAPPDTISLPTDPMMDNIVPHPSLMRPYFHNQPPSPPNFAVSLLVDVLSGIKQYHSLDRVWLRLESTGFAFDAHNWNRRAVALMHAGRVIEACEIVSTRLLRDPRDADIEDTSALTEEERYENDALEPVWLREVVGAARRREGLRPRDRASSLDESEIFAPFPHQRTMTVLAMWMEKLQAQSLGNDEEAVARAAVLTEVETRFPDVVDAVRSGELAEFRRDLGENVVDEEIEAEWREWEEEDEWNKKEREKRAEQLFYRWRRKPKGRMPKRKEGNLYYTDS